MRHQRRTRMKPSQFEKQFIQCPVCLNEEEATLWPLINAGTDPDLKLRLLKKLLQIHPCSNCGHEVLIAFDMVYLDPDKKLLLVCKPGLQDMIQHDASQARHADLSELLADVPDSEQALEPGWQVRMTDDMNHLIEKIHIFDTDRDDRLIELLKLSLLRQKNQEVEAKRLYYYASPELQDKHLRFMVEGQDEKWYHLDLDEQIYVNTADMIAQAEVALTSPLVVDSVFAEQLLLQLAAASDND